MKEIREIPSWHFLRIKLFRRVVFGEELHPDHGENIDHDYQHEGEITECTDRTDYNAEEDLHRDPRLCQFEHSQLKNRFVT